MSCCGASQIITARVFLLDESTFETEVKDNDSGSALLNQVFKQLNLFETDYFGLRFVDNQNQPKWLDSSKSLKSQVHESECDFYFGIKFYAADPCKLRDELTRYLFFLQLKKDVLQGRLPLAFDVAVELFAFSLQSELGDYDPRKHTIGYVSEIAFLPNQTEEIEATAARKHSKMRGVVPSKAELHFLNRVKWLDMYGVDLHQVIGDDNVEYFLGLTPVGVTVYKMQNKVANYFWPRIAKINFKKDQFILSVRDNNNEENPYVFKLPSKDAAKHLWKCCVEHHAFFRLRTGSESRSKLSHYLSGSSKFRGRTQQELQESFRSETITPPVQRVSSRRRERRNSISSIRSLINATTVSPQNTITPNRASQGCLNNAFSPVSDQQPNQDVPWESETAPRGLYTTGRDSPTSVHSASTYRSPLYRHRRDSGSETESGLKRKHHQSRKASDPQQEVMVLGQYISPGYEPDGASEVEQKSQRRRKSKERMAHSQSQYLSNGGTEGNDMVRSMTEPNLEDAAEEAERRRRKRRSRSRSPGSQKNQPPDELLQHFDYGLKDTNGLSMEELKDIPYTSVETNAPAFRISYSPHSRQRKYSPHRRRSNPPDVESIVRNPHFRDAAAFSTASVVRTQDVVISPPNSNGSPLKSPHHYIPYSSSAMSNGEPLPYGSTFSPVNYMGYSSYPMNGEARLSSHPAELSSQV